MVTHYFTADTDTMDGMITIAEQKRDQFLGGTMYSTGDYFLVNARAVFFCQPGMHEVCARLVLRSVYDFQVCMYVTCTITTLQCC